MRNRISVQIALAVSILALIGALSVSFLSYFSTYSREVGDSRRTLLQLGQTVQSTASIAAYMNDPELANEVMQGLAKNEIVASVKLSGTTGLSAHLGSPKSLRPEQVVRLKLDSPFTPGESVGELVVTLRDELIDGRARQSAWKNAALLGGYTLFVALLVLLLIQWRLISGIKQIAGSLSKITPGQEQRLTHPALHKKDEFGGLVDDINKLLDLVHEKLESERVLLSQVETLEKRFRMIYERAGVGIFLMDQRARLVMANPAFREIVGDDVAADVLDEDINCMIELFSESDATLTMLEETFVLGRLSTSDLLLNRPGEKTHWVHCLLTQVRDNTNGSFFVQGIISDISERKLEEQKMRFQAERDPLTHLLNRRSGERSMRLLLEKSEFEGSCLAVCLLDLDNFKPINDTYGHDAGDKVLVETARRIGATLRSSDLIARLGGDEFLLVIQGGGSRPDMEMLLDKLLANITQDVDIGNGTLVKVGASIGVAATSMHGTEPDQLLAFADQAMYQVKKHGKKGYQFYGANNA